MENTTDNNRQVPKKDRLLGDEWENWTGNLDESIAVNENNTLFILFAVLSVALIMAVMLFILYMVEPRLLMISGWLLVAVRSLIIVLLAIILAWFALVLLTVLTGKSLVPGTRAGQVAATLILPFALVLARRLGISRDRLGNSFVRFSNAIVSVTHRPGPGKTVILLPRCLTPSLKKEVKDLAESADVKVFTVTGGGQARKVIRDEHPSAVIGVACERDLISGIHDVAPKLPTIGITNKRPEGPCKNTIIDMNELRKAIAIFTGKTVE